jgi:hypothetical protein
MSRAHDLFWAEFFGIPAADFDEPGTSVVQHVGLAGYRGVWFFRRGPRLVVSAPDGWLVRIRGGLADIASDRRLPAEEDLRRFFGRDLERCIGPAFHGAIDSTGFRPAHSENVRSLENADAAAIAAFRKDCSPGDWDASGLDEARHDRAAYFEDGTITAMAGLRRRSATVADPCF